MSDGQEPDLVLGDSKLVVDLIRARIGPSAAGPAVAVLVDPTERHWEQTEGFGGAVVVVLADPHAQAIVTAVRRGAVAVVASDEVEERLARAVETVRAGGAWLESAHLRAVCDALQHSAPVDDRPALSTREREILESIVEGRSVKQTAVHLGVAPKTIENLQGRLFKKLDARNRAHAVTRAFELRLLDLADGDPSETP